MQYNFKKRNNRNQSQNQGSWSISLRVKKVTPFGMAVFACGNIAELGLWNPANSLRLTWSHNNLWIATVQLKKCPNHPIEFKFITSDWEILQNNAVEWEVGKRNRRIDISSLRPHTRYNAEWNKQEITLCLHSTNKNLIDYRYFATGSIKQLGNWNYNQEMHLISKDVRDTLNCYFKTDPEFLCEISLNTIFTYTFTVNLDTDKINYTYIRKGEINEREMFIGRSFNLKGETNSKGRIKLLDWAGSKYIIDQPIFDKLVLQKLTNQLYMATSLKNCSHFDRIQERHITAIFNINSIDEDCTISNYHLSALCKMNGIEIRHWTVGDVANNNFVKETKEIVSNLQKLLAKGHRVCIHCSKKLVKSIPIKILYLTLLEGYPLLQAIELVKREASITEINCKIAEDVFYIVNNKICRGKIQIKSH